MKTWQIKIEGRVQGVGYRYFAQNAAQKFSLKGWVRNCSDGSVEIHAQGKDEQIALFLNALQKGPLMSSVERVDSVILDFDEYKSFTIKGW